MEEAGRGRHNHQRCIARALDHAEAVCADSGSRMTALRRKVLQQVWRGHDAVKAYDILNRLGGRRPLKPPSVYRALQFLQERGLVHRLESLNAFVGCAQPDAEHQGQFLICGGCGSVRELEASGVSEMLAEQARNRGFAPHRQTIEVHGLCRQCR